MATIVVSEDSLLVSVLPPFRAAGPQLLCPHSTLKHTPQGTVAMVTGQYAYYHYMQDNFNDSVILTSGDVSTPSLPPSLSLVAAGLGVCLSLSSDPMVMVQLAGFHSAGSTHSSADSRGLGCHW